LAISQKKQKTSVNDRTANTACVNHLSSPRLPYLREEQ